MLVNIISYCLSLNQITGSVSQFVDQCFCLHIAQCGPMGYVSSCALMLECHPRRRRVRQRLHRLVCCQVSWTKSLLVCQPTCPLVRRVPNRLLRQPVSSLFQAFCEASVLVNVSTGALVSRFY